MTRSPRKSASTRATGLDQAVLDRFIERLPAATRRAVYLAAVPHEVDESILRILLEDEPQLNPLETLERLVALPPLRVARAGRYRMKSVVRQALLRAWRAEGSRDYQRLGERLSEVFWQRAREKGPRHGCEAEAVYHAIEADPSTGFVRFQDLFEGLRDACLIDEAEHLRSVIMETSDRLDDDQRAWLAVYAAELLMDAGAAELALRELHRLMDDDKSSGRIPSSALRMRMIARCAECLAARGDMRAAFEACEELETRLAKLATRGAARDVHCRGASYFRTVMPLVHRVYPQDPPIDLLLDLAIIAARSGAHDLARGAFRDAYTHSQLPRSLRSMVWRIRDRLRKPDGTAAGGGLDPHLDRLAMLRRISGRRPSACHREGQGRSRTDLPGQHTGTGAKRDDAAIDVSLDEWDDDVAA